MSTPHATPAAGSDWRSTVYRLVIRWGAENRMPTPEEWDEWTAAAYEAARARRASGWLGVDRIEDDAYAAGYAAAEEEATERFHFSPAGDYPYP